MREVGRSTKSMLDHTMILSSEVTDAFSVYISIQKNTETLKKVPKIQYEVLCTTSTVGLEWNYHGFVFL